MLTERRARPPSGLSQRRISGCSRSLRELCGLREGRLLRAGLGLELLDYAVQSFLMRGGYRQELQADAGGPGPADCGIID